jgi:uncharacterized membrane protein
VAVDAPCDVTRKRMLWSVHADRSRGLQRHLWAMRFAVALAICERAAMAGLCQAANAR